jgi:phage tail-like protein
MATVRTNPYGAFRFQVEFGAVPGGPGAFSAGFSEVNGLGMEVNFSEYREGTDPTNTVRKIPNTFKLESATLKRGLIGATELFEWIKAIREGHQQPRTVTIVLLDEAGNDSAHFVLKNAQCNKWKAPPLVAKGGGDVAMEEMGLVYESIEYE